MRTHLDVSSKLVSRFEGRIARYFDDGLLVYFGYPSAHEDDAKRAVCAGLEIVDAFGQLPLENTQVQLPLQVRVGIHTGLMVIGEMKVKDTREPIEIVGGTPNIAARLLSVAEPYTVVISSATYRLVEGLFEYHYLGLHTLKGFSTPLDVYRVLHESGVRSRFDVSITKGLTPLVGREKEVELLLECWEQVKEGAGQVVTIIGDAGIGKSRLLYEFRKLIEDEKILYLEGRCISYGKSISYLPVTDIIKKRFRIDNLDTERTIRKNIEKGIRDIDPNLEGSIPFLYDILSIETDALLKSLDLRDKRKRTLETLKNIILADSNLRPLVVAVENLHWIDGASEEFLTFLIDNIPSSKIMLILTSRPGYRAKWSEKSYHIQIAPSRLSDKEVEEMIKSILDSERVTGELIKLVTNKADGIPFYVEEIIKSFIESEIIVRREDGYSISKSIAEVDVPDTIQDIIMARIDRLEENLKRTLQYASVIGREFSYKLLKEIIEIEEELQDYLTQLKGLELIYEKSLFPDLEYRFKHSLTQEVAYNSLLIKRRKELHGKIGEILEDLYGDKLEENYELLAYHYRRSTRDEKAVDYLTLAGDKSAKIYSTEDA
ncbi:MAG: AAA family ATPase [Deltaproteobacteria bacterium]|nr:AAA family ATPase [Deltaproteobacteria bacterium]